jgi:phage-related protein
MSKYDNIGELMHLPLESITSLNENIGENEFVMNAAVDALLQSNGRNWIPLIVVQTNNYKYQIVANHFIYTVAQRANVERIWCMVIPFDEQNIKQAKLLNREIDPQININTASFEMIETALRYLADFPEKPLKGVDIKTAAQKIAAANDRKQWTNFQPITKLKCKITANKLDSLHKVFFVSTVQMSQHELVETLESINIKQATFSEIVERLHNLAQQYPIDFNVDIEELAETIFNADKAKWRSLNPLEKIDPFFDKKKITYLKTLFSIK